MKPLPLKSYVNLDPFTTKSVVNDQGNSSSSGGVFSRLGPDDHKRSYRKRIHIYHRELLYYRCVSVVTVPLLTLVVICLGILLGVYVSVLYEESRIHSHVTFPSKTLNLLSQLMKEETTAIDFISHQSQGVSDTERSSSILQSHAVTISTLEDLLNSYRRDFPYLATEYVDAPNPFLILPISLFVEIKDRVLRRSITVGEVAVFYQNAKIKVLHQLKTFVALSTSKMAVNSENEVLIAQLEWYTSLEQELLDVIEETGTVSSDTLGLLLEIQHDWRYTSTLMKGYFSESNTAVINDISKCEEAAEEVRDVVLQSVTLPDDWKAPHTDTSVSAKSIVLAAVETVDYLKDEIDYIATLSVSTIGDTERVIILSVFAMLLSVTCIIITLRNLIKKTINQSADMEREVRMSALVRSETRMSLYVTAVCNLNLQRAREYELISEYDFRDSKLLVHPAERDLHGLNHAIFSLVRFFHYALLRFRYPGPFNVRKEPVIRHLVRIKVTLLFIELPFLKETVTSETSKLNPYTLNVILKGLASIAESYGGCFHEISGTRVIIAWNLACPCSDPETAACKAATNISQAWRTAFGLSLGHLSGSKSFVSGPSEIYFSIVTGRVFAGVAGSDTLKSFTLQGSILHLGLRLLKHNVYHDTTVIMDNTTFSAIDWQTFNTKPLEIMRMYVGGPMTTIHTLLLGDKSSDILDTNTVKKPFTELHYTLAYQTPTSRVEEPEARVTITNRTNEGSLLLWNEAFDELKAGDLEQANKTFLQFQSNFGSSKTLRRLLSLLMESPPRAYSLPCDDIDEEYTFT